jgi:3-keto-disaccharide hydrolase
MKRWLSMIAVLLVVFGALYFNNASAQTAWTTLFDGKNLNAFNSVGNANWKIVDGVVQADSGAGYLTTKQPYGDFEIKAEFWVDEKANSGIFIRCENPQMLGADTCYEVNIYDTRPDPTYGTGAIVNVGKPSTMLKAGGKWNTYEIKAQGPRMIVTLNGVQTVDVQDTKHARGVIGLQYGAGVVKFRLVQIRTL